MNKENLDRIVRAAGMRPEKREHYKDFEIFVADGFSLMPHRAFQKFGVDPDEFPHGMYVTMWWVSKDTEKLDVGSHLFFDVMHDPTLTPEMKKRARINRAFKEAQDFIERRKRLN